MIRKARNFSCGVKGTTALDTIKHKPHRPHKTIDSEERVNICLNCTKPASQCKGDCFKKEKDEN